MNIKIGIAPASWGVWFASDPLQPPWERFLDEVVEAGFEWIELGPYEYLPADSTQLQAELGRRGLKVCSGFAMKDLADPSAWPELERQVLGMCEILADLGAPFFHLLDDAYTDLHSGEPVGPVRLDEDAWQRLIDTTHSVAEIAWEQFRMKLTFEPHTDSHVEYEDQIEAFLEQTDPARVLLCLDIGHHANRDGDPIRFMRKHHERIPYLHLKDIDPTVHQKVKTEGLSLSAAVKMGIWCEPSQGAIDFTALAKTLQEIQWQGWAVVEQGMYPAPFDKPLPIAKRTREYLREIGFG